MALTRFPIETSDPRIQVTLPIGRHVLELVVEDSAGLRSAPDQVIIEVRQEAAVPTITGINPLSGTPGSRVEAVISGTNLGGATAVTFANEGIGAAIGVGGTATSLPVVITIKSEVAAGTYGFTVATPGGRANSPSGVTFSVYREPQVVEPRIIPTPRVATPEPITTEPRVLATQPVTPEITPVVAETRPVTPEVRPVVAETLPVTPEVRPVIAETRPVTPEVSPVIAETRAITPAVTPTVVETRAITPVVTPVTEPRVTTPVIRKTGTKAAAGKSPTGKKKK